MDDDDTLCSRRPARPTSRPVQPIDLRAAGPAAAMDWDTAGLLRAARRAADLSQRDLAERAGVSRGVVSAIEAGRRTPGATTLTRLLRAAGCRLLVWHPSHGMLAPFDHGELRDASDRRYPAHLDLREPMDDLDWWGGGWPMFFYETPARTFDRQRANRDLRRDRLRGDGRAGAT